jgi:hypothetical protein
MPDNAMLEDTAESIPAFIDELHDDALDRR